MTITLPDGTEVGLGLQMPTPGFVSALPVYADVGPMLTRQQIEDIARSGTMRGRDRFDSSYIKDQKSHGSCNGFAGAAALTRARVRRGLPRIDLSGAYLYSLINDNVDRGSLLDRGMMALLARGCAAETTVGWAGIFRSLYETRVADAEAARMKAFECYQVNDEGMLWSGLASGFDAVVAVHADAGFMKLDANGVAGGGQGGGNHAVGVSGLWWDRELIADAYNSWGLSYGDQGRMGLTWDRHFRPTHQNHAFYLIRSATDDPQSENPPVAGG